MIAALSPYNAAGQRIETSSVTLTTSYRYDSVGNLLEQAISGASEIAFSYAYDALGQLTSFLQSTILSIDAAMHRKISVYYSSKQPFTRGLTVRNRLAGQDFEMQYYFGLQVLEML